MVKSYFSTTRHNNDYNSSHDQNEYTEDCKDEDEVIPDQRTPYGFFPRDHPTIGTAVRPSVEWVYPSGFTGTRNEQEYDGTAEEPEGSEIDVIVIDPNDVEVTLDVEGTLVKERLCFIKFCGCVVCDDTFPLLLNSKIFLFLIGVIFVVGTIAAAVLVEEDMSSTGLQKIDNVNPYNTTVGESSTSVDFVDFRINEITQALFEISGSVILEENSSQKKALDWILYDDDLKLAHNCSTLLQRYSIMVFFFNLSGENWFQKYGYGSGKDECEWHGITCHNFKDVSAEIKYIKLMNNSLKGHIPNEIMVFSELRKLELDGNLITGSIPTTIGNLKALERLDLSYNRLTGTIPATITSCGNLERFYVKENMISGRIPEFSSKQWALSRIVLEANNFSGTVPTSLGSLNALEHLQLTSNRLTGTIPPELGKAIGLTILDLDNNDLTGQIPSSIGRLSNLREVLLSQNSLSGTIPPSLYRFSNIRGFALNDNLLSGSIPFFVDFLPSAQQIYLYGNMINGTIPEHLGDLPKLAALELHFSSLSGTVPQSICDRQLNRLTANCAGINASVSCSCCTKCF